MELQNNRAKALLLLNSRLNNVFFERDVAIPRYAGCEAGEHRFVTGDGKYYAVDLVTEKVRQELPALGIRVTIYPKES